MSESTSHDSPEEIAKHVRVYMLVFAALLVGTVITVLASYVNLGHFGNIFLALVIATVKAALVAGYFMHLISEKTAIYTILGTTAFFFVGLMFLTIWAMNDIPGMHGIH